jgi:hypothetical protein
MSWFDRMANSKNIVTREFRSLDEADDVLFAWRQIKTIVRIPNISDGKERSALSIGEVVGEPRPGA